METRCQCCGGKIAQHDISASKYCNVCKKRYSIKDTKSEKNTEIDNTKPSPVYTYNDKGERVLHKVQTSSRIDSFIKVRGKRCVVCGKEFVAVSGGAKYCSQTCRLAAKRK